MNTIAIINLSVAIFCSFLIWYLYFELYKEYAIDCFRQDVFELRDNLFDDAAKGLIDFNHPAYCLLRRTMNGNIRYSHRVSILNSLIIAIMFRNSELKKAGFSFEEKLKLAMDGLDVEVKEKILNYRKKLQVIFLKHLVRESPITFFFLLLLLAITIIPFIVLIVFRNSVFSFLRSILFQEIDSIESTALAAGKISCS
jgi:hypothetical protein